LVEDMVVLFFVCASLSWIAWVVVVAAVRLHASRKQAALQSRLLEILSNAPNVVEYMNGDAGRELVQSLAAAPERPHARILNTLQAGIVLLLGGTSLLVARLFVERDTTPLLVAGLAIAGSGLGLGAAAAAAYALSKRFGLLPDTNG
jgi:hypothetical protein